ncbi:MAG TPA: AAA family ATPase [Burkholderiales bacterium]|nr:AAA family ATPase [Burkholderiales bacterium]
MKTLPRLVEPALSERLRVMPAVVVTGARQTGKSTLAAERVPGKRRYASLDDLDVGDAAKRDPEALVGGSQAVTLDEVQREPEILAAVSARSTAIARPGVSCSPARPTCCSCAGSRFCGTTPGRRRSERRGSARTRSGVGRSTRYPGIHG